MTAALLVLLGVVIGFMLNVLKDIIFERRRRIQDGQHLAARVVPVLADFMDECRAVVHDTGGYETQSHGQDELKPIASAPSRLTYPTDVDWRAIEHRLMLDALALPAKLSAAHAAIDAIIEYVAGPPNYGEFFEERRLKFADLIIKTSVVADALRSQHGVWLEDCMSAEERDQLQSLISEVQRSIAEREQRNQEM
ncbi:MAG: hypothetical protein AAGB04_06495 [Pseudomonadota bacterium]